MSDNTIYECYECGEPFRIEADGVSYHAGPQGFGEVGQDPYDLDEDHVPFGYVDCFQCGSETDTPANERGCDDEGNPLGVACDRCLTVMDGEAREAEHQADLLDAAEKVW